MEHVLVRYSEIATKSRHVKRQMRDVLRQRVEDRLVYEGIGFDRVSSKPGRVIVETKEPREAAAHVSELPGVASASPAIKTEADIDHIGEASEEFDYGDSFGVDAGRTGEHGFTSQDVERELGSHIEGFSGSGVDLDHPDTLLEVDIRHCDAYLFTERYQGPGGLPVGSQDPLLALISGGIDSPVAAYQVMKRGSGITPIYFYNRPIAAEDHLLRFKSALGELERFHPGKQWRYYVVDMGEVNRELMDVGRGRMVLHRIVMFRVAGKLADENGFRGLVTGESLGQKSSQTASNLEMTTSEVEKPVFRPLVGWNKNEIVEVAKRLGTFEVAGIDSACTTLAPESPATSLQCDDLERLKAEVDIDRLVEQASENVERHVLGDRKD